MLDSIKHLLIGPPLPTRQLADQRLSKVRGLAAFSPDALSSIAYANQEIYLALVVAGTSGLAAAWPIGIGITALLIIVALSYYQTVHGYPSGGGSYVVSRENLGDEPALIAAVRATGRLCPDGCGESHRGRCSPGLGLPGALGSSRGAVSHPVGDHHDVEPSGCTGDGRGDGSAGIPIPNNLSSYAGIRRRASADRRSRHFSTDGLTSHSAAYLDDTASRLLDWLHCADRR